MIIKRILPLLLVLVLVSCNTKKDDGISTDIINNPNSASGQEDIGDLPVITFKEERIEFGDVSQGERIIRIFEFTNTGESNLVLEGVEGECGCTVAKNWPKDPIKPGESGLIEVAFDSGKLYGQQVKRITVTANTHPTTNVVALAGNVVGPEKK